MARDVLHRPKNPDVYLLDDIYDPHRTGPHNGHIIPQVGSFVSDPDGGHIFWVTDVDTETYKSSMVLMKVDTEEIDTSLIASNVSYGNDIFCLFYDERTTPTSVFVDSRFALFGTNMGSYRLIRNPDSEAENVISLYIDAEGKMAGARIPLEQTDNSNNTWFCVPGYTKETLVENERIRLEIFNEAGVLVTSNTLITKPASILNTQNQQVPVIADLEIDSAQMRGNNEIYIYEYQNVGSLTITGILTFSDGQTKTVSPDNARVFLYGLEDFIPSYAGLRQKILLKYFLGQDEVADRDLGDVAVCAVAYLVVVPNELRAGVKISVLPYYITTENTYRFRYRLYSLDRDISKDITDHVVVTPDWNGDQFGFTQSRSVEIDLNRVDPEKYPEETIHRQQVLIKLQPPVADIPYTIQDSASSAYVYGVDSGQNRRPLIQYIPETEQYVIPSERFPTKENFIETFYRFASPPRDVTEKELTHPTHILLRNFSNGKMIVPQPIPLADYAVPFNAITPPDQPDMFAGGPVVVEFIAQINDKMRAILYGVPVEVKRVITSPTP